MNPAAFAVMTMLLASGLAFADEAAPAAVMNLWPPSPADAADTLSQDKAHNILRANRVVTPTISVYPAAKPADGKPAPAVLVCPGGAYSLLALDLEGTEVAQWFQSVGVTAVLLKYRVPDNRDGAFQDAQRAMSLIRQNAKLWNIAPDRVGVIGFSAGAHLAARLSNTFQKRAYPAVDAADKLPCRPDFTVLVYPAYLVKPDNASLADGITVTAKTPPAFLVQTQDDPCRVECSLVYYQALQKVKVPAELHVFPDGGHGYGLRPSAHAVSGWPELCRLWLQSIGITAPRAKPPPTKTQKS